MATFVLEAPVQQSKPEIIFVANQSGSMQGVKTETLVAALRVLLKLRSSSTCAILEAATPSFSQKAKCTTKSRWRRPSCL